MREGVKQIELPQAAGIYLVQLLQNNYAITEKIRIE